MAIHQDQEEKVDGTNRLEGRDNIEHCAARDNFFPVFFIDSIKSSSMWLKTWLKMILKIWSTNCVIGQSEAFIERTIYQLTPKIVIIWVVVKKVDVSSSFPTDTLGGLLTSVALGRNFSCHFLLRLFPARDSFTLIIREEIRHSLDMKKASRNSLVAAFASSHHFSLVVRKSCRSGFVQERL